MTTNGSQPWSIKNWISQQPLIGSFWNFRLLLKWRWPPMEDNLKIFKVEYLRNHLSDIPQVLNLSSWDLTKIKNAWNEDEHQWKMTSCREQTYKQCDRWTLGLFYLSADRLAGWLNWVYTVSFVWLNPDPIAKLKVKCKILCILINSASFCTNSWFLIAYLKFTAIR